MSRVTGEDREEERGEENERRGERRERERGGVAERGRREHDEVCCDDGEQRLHTDGGGGAGPEQLREGEKEGGRRMINRVAVPPSSQSAESQCFL